MICYENDYEYAFDTHRRNLREVLDTFTAVVCNCHSEEAQFKRWAWEDHITELTARCSIMNQEWQRAGIVPYSYVIGNGSVFNCDAVSFKKICDLLHSKSDRESNKLANSILLKHIRPHEVIEVNTEDQLKIVQYLMVQIHGECVSNYEGRIGSSNGRWLINPRYVHQVHYIDTIGGKKAVKFEEFLKRSFPEYDYLFVVELWGCNRIKERSNICWHTGVCYDYDARILDFAGGSHFSVFDNSIKIDKSYYRVPEYAIKSTKKITFEDFKENIISITQKFKIDTKYRKINT